MPPVEPDNNEDQSVSVPDPSTAPLTPPVEPTVVDGEVSEPELPEDPSPAPEPEVGQVPEAPTPEAGDVPSLGSEPVSEPSESEPPVEPQQ
jgi:hypothetical protein